MKMNEEWCGGGGCWGVVESSEPSVMHTQTRKEGGCAMELLHFVYIRGDRTRPKSAPKNESLYPK
jgi:hypothetical protein